MLNRKLLRDFARLRGQVVTIAIVVACGIATLVEAVATYQSLVASRAEFYRQAHFAQVFAGAKRAPQAVAARLAAIPGIATLETRVVEDATLILHDGEPLTGHIVSLPENAPSLLNRLYLRSGRVPEPGAAGEVAVGEAFAVANHLRLGDRIDAVLNGRSVPLRVVGVVLSAEFVFATRPGDPIPDDRRYGILWMNRRPLAAAFDLQGAFNDVVATLAPGASRPAVLAGLDGVLDPYGGLVAYGRADQPSNRFLADEIAQQRIMAVTMPPIFLAVAVFLLHGMLHRLVQAQREQIAALKALGYGNAAIGWHFAKFALVVVGAGALVGVALGVWFGTLMVRNYTAFFRFPILAFHIAAWVPLLAIGVSLAAGLAGSYAAVASVARLAPAEGMRPPAPPSHRQTMLDRFGPVRRMTASGHMVLRRLTARPWRTVLTVAGIALSVPIIVVTLFWRDALDYMIDVQFAAAARADVTVAFSVPVPGRAQREIAHLPGVLETEAVRSVPVRLRYAQHSYRIALTGMPSRPVLQRLVDADMRIVPLPADGLLLSRRLAERLHVRAGDMIEVDVLDGDRRRLMLPVAGELRELLGIGAYIRIDALHRLLGEGDTVSAIGVATSDKGDLALRRALLDRPKVAALSDRTVSLQQFRATTEVFVLVMAGVLSLFSIMIAIGVVYNHARIALQERAWELASLRVLGFTRGEVTRLLLAELLVELVLAVAIGLWLGHWLVRALIALHTTEMFEIPAIVRPRSYAIAALIVLLSGAASAWLVRRRIDRLDLVGVLKARE